MFEITQTVPNRLDITVQGQIDADQMKAGLDQLLQKAEGMQNATMLYRITDFSMPTMGALGVEMTQLPKLFGLLGKFSKCAVVSDTAWIRQAAEVEGALIPGLTIKGFETANTDNAAAWLAA
ncbi:MAG: STAS/SEC14 domain-containing protein [Yoonia sp.]|uniref:STAS/SEC14 domain-containing protein n=1 Tax=Yoonia sp. TaxID=2212373 RepID=UPI003EF3A405